MSWPITVVLYDPYESKECNTKKIEIIWAMRVWLAVGHVTWNKSLHISFMKAGQEKTQVWLPRESKFCCCASENACTVYFVQIVLWLPYWPTHQQVAFSGSKWKLKLLAQLTSRFQIFFLSMEVLQNAWWFFGGAQRTCTLLITLLKCC